MVVFYRLCRANLKKHDLDSKINMNVNQKTYNFALYSIPIYEYSCYFFFFFHKTNTALCEILIWKTLQRLYYYPLFNSTLFNLTLFGCVLFFNIFKRNVFNGTSTLFCTPNGKISHRQRFI